jgi:hypothetical protein
MSQVCSKLILVLSMTKVVISDEEDNEIIWKKTRKGAIICSKIVRQKFKLLEVKAAISKTYDIMVLKTQIEIFARSSSRQRRLAKVIWPQSSAGFYHVLLAAATAAARQGNRTENVPTFQTFCTGCMIEDMYILFFKWCIVRDKVVVIFKLPNKEILT